MVAPNVSADHSSHNFLSTLALTHDNTIRITSGFLYKLIKDFLKLIKYELQNAEPKNFEVICSYELHKTLFYITFFLQIWQRFGVSQV